MCAHFSARVKLVEGGPRVLRAMPPELSAEAHAQLDKLGVQVVVVAHLNVTGFEHIHVIGDMASATSAQRGLPLQVFHYADLATFARHARIVVGSTDHAPDTTDV